MFRPVPAVRGTSSSRPSFPKAVNALTSPAPIRSAASAMASSSSSSISSCGSGTAGASLLNASHRAEANLEELSWADFHRVCTAKCSEAGTADICLKPSAARALERIAWFFAALHLRDCLSCSRADSILCLAASHSCGFLLLCRSWTRLAHSMHASWLRVCDPSEASMLILRLQRNYKE